jgi:hypothetical protein
VFRIFFAVVADSIREVLAEAWTPLMTAAWQDLLEQLDYYVTHPNQYETIAAAKTAGDDQSLFAQSRGCV